MKSCIAIIILGLCSIGSAQAATPPPVSSLQAKVETVAKQLVDAHKVAGISYAIVRDGHIILNDSVGLRDVARSLPATRHTVFRIGSVSKLITAVAVMQLVEAHKLSLDDSLAKFFPKYPHAGSITVQDLLMHRSGITNYLDQAIHDGRYLRPTTPQAIIAWGERQPLEFSPGTKFSYSNTNYVLLGLIVEHLSGLSLASYDQRYVFEPAKMTHTYAQLPPPHVKTAVGYTLANEAAQNGAGDLSWYFACGDIYSTAGDLARFDLALMDGRLITKKSFATMIAVAQPSYLGPGIKYGLGITTGTFGKQVLVGHHGGLPGFEADDEMIPASGFAVISLGNDFGYLTNAILNTALQYAYPADFAASVKASMKANTANAARAQREQRILIPRFTKFFVSLLAKKLDVKAGLSKEMLAALTPQAINTIQRSLASLGSFQKFTYGSEDQEAGYLRYHYIAVFDHGTKGLVFVLDGDGNIAGMFYE